MKTIILNPSHTKYIEQINNILTEAFEEGRPGKWLKDIEKSFNKDRISIAAIDNMDNAVGWIGGISQYGGNVWELHPLAVKKEYRANGIGSMLVRKFETEVSERGGLTIWLGTDDENNATSLSNTDLYENTYDKMRDIVNHNRHPFEFYKKLGYTIVSVMPDANGIGKPDIYMAKRVEK
ncbi:MAG: GNAT family N-acetyltransferase [Bacillota bacterium]